MSEITSIQWCDSTINPIMGCGGCELFPPPATVLSAIDRAVSTTGHTINSRKIYRDLVSETFEKIVIPITGHKNVVNTTNIWHLREPFLEQVKQRFGGEAEAAAKLAVEGSVTCYAAKLHLNKGANILKPDRSPKAGYAPIFEAVTHYPDRMSSTATWKDLLGRTDPTAPWKERLPRMIFISDMGDALSTAIHFPFLQSELMPAIQSENGKLHLWIWLTKRPDKMAKFAKKVGGFPNNLCAMTTVTGPDTLDRVDHLRAVDASVRGLSIEPLWERIPSSQLDLTGIDWVIVGGESGAGKSTRPFAVEWAEELRDHCRQHGVAFFLKQLGRNPSRNGTIFQLKDRHGGEWEEWDEKLRVREFPQAFHKYRKQDLQQSDYPRPSAAPKSKANTSQISVTSEDSNEFKKLDRIVRKGMIAFVETGQALSKIKERSLWRAGRYPTWESYCREVAGISKAHAHRLMSAAKISSDLVESLPIGNDSPWLIPQSESQLRPLFRLTDPVQQREAWRRSIELSENLSPTAAEVSAAVAEIQGTNLEDEHALTRSERRANLVKRLQTMVAKRGSWDELERLLSELENLL